METVPKDSITSVRLSLQVDGSPHFLIALDAEGHVKRMGRSDLAIRDGRVAAGRIESVLPRFMEVRGSAGLPPAVAALVGRADELTEAWYQETVTDQRGPGLRPG